MHNLWVFFDKRNTNGRIRSRQDQAKTFVFALVLMLLTACGSQTATSNPSPVATPIATAPATQETAAPKATPTTAIPTVQTAPSPANTPGLSPSAAITVTPTYPTPTPSGPVSSVDATYELDLTKQAFDDIRQNFYKEPDSASMLKAGLTAASAMLTVPAPQVQFTSNADSNWSAFSVAFNAMVKEAAQKTAKGDLAHRMIDAFATSVNDLHTYLVTADEYTAEKAQQHGDFSTVGFGFTVDYDSTTGNPVIQKVLSGSPAEQAGLRGGDTVLSFNSKPVNKQNWRSTVHATPEGAQGTFVVQRIDAGTLTIVVTKKRYTIVSVESKVLNNHIGYIAIDNFLTNVTTEFDKALANLHAKGVDSLIVDVRDDPGGYQYANIAARFVQPGSIIGYTVNRSGRHEVKADAGNVKNLPVTPKLPLVVLINGSSYSSSEIFALSIREYKAGTLVGTRSGGALGETVPYELKDGWAIYVTLDTFESRDGEKFNNTGIPPDIAISTSLDDLAHSRDPQLDAAEAQVERLASKS